MPGRISPERSTRNTFGPKLKEIRLSKGITATFIIGKLQRQGWSVSNYTYTQIEAGKRILGDTELVMILAVLGLRLRDLE